MDTIELYIKADNTTPIRLSAAYKEPSAEKTAGMAYWALSFDAFGPYPPVLVHVYCPGELPDDDRRDFINAAVKSYVGELLTGERGDGHIDRD